MITTLAFYLVGFIIQIFALALPTWSIWPDDIKNGLNYFVSSMANWNFLFPVDTIFKIIILFTEFLAAYIVYKLVSKILNYLRGTGSGL